MDVREAMALSALGLITSGELVEVGTKALSSGIDSPTVCRLAGLVSCDYDQAKDLFESFVQECGYVEFDLREAAIVSILPIAKKLASGQVCPMDAANTFQRICSAAGYPDELLPLGGCRETPKFSQ